MELFRLESLAMVFASIALSAQDRPPLAVIGSGYSSAAPTIAVAPGQVLTLNIYGLDYRLSQPLGAGRIPLPFELSGLSVTLEQGNTRMRVPLLAISQQRCPPSPDPCAPQTSISVQVPFDARVNSPGTEVSPVQSFLVLSENGQNRGSASIRVLTDNVHIANTCDSTAIGSASDGAGCRAVVAHADGTYVSRAVPARPGETLILYAFGLGQPDFPVGSGQGTPSEFTVSMKGAFTISIESLNSGPDGVPTPADAIAPSFTGLAPGFVGLYQLNFKVPALVPSMNPCTENVPYNARISLTGAASSATEQICINPGP